MRHAPSPFGALRSPVLSTASPLRWMPIVAAAVAATTATPAAAGGYYHPADVAQASATYARAAESAAGQYDGHAAAAERVAAALAQYEEALDLLGAAAPAGERDRLQELTLTFNREFAALQSFANYMVEDFDNVFVGAMERAVAGLDASQCEGQIPVGPAMPGIPQRYQANPECQGDDLNATIAGKMDADAELTKAIDEIVSIEWPAITQASDAQAVVGSGDRYVHVGALLHASSADALRQILREDEDARLDFQAAIEMGADKEERRSLVSQAEAVTAATAGKRASLAGPVLEAADAALEKLAKKGEPATGWCANPSVLGGCSGTDGTGQLVPVLLDDKKVRKAAGL